MFNYFKVSLIDRVINIEESGFPKSFYIIFHYFLLEYKSLTNSFLKSKWFITN